MEVVREEEPIDISVSGSGGSSTRRMPAAKPPNLNFLDRFHPTPPRQQPSQSHLTDRARSTQLHDTAATSFDLLAIRNAVLATPNHARLDASI